MAYMTEAGRRTGEQLAFLMEMYQIKKSVKEGRECVADNVREAIADQRKQDAMQEFARNISEAISRDRSLRLK